MATAKSTTRERLLDAAERVFAEKGFHQAAVDEIVEVSGTSKGSVYFHFPSKENLFLAVMDHLGNRLVSRVEREARRVADPVERLNVALETTVRTLYRHRTLANLLLVKGNSIGAGFAQKRQEIFGRFSELTAGLIRDAVAARREDDADIDAEIVAQAWLGAVGELIVRWLETGEPDPMEQSLPTLRLLLHRGLGLEPVVAGGAA